MSAGPMDAADRRVDIEARLSLLHLSGMGPSRIRWLLGRLDPVTVVERMRSGSIPAPAEAPPPGVNRDDVDQWLTAVVRLDPGALHDAQVQNGRYIIHPEDPDWPFRAEPEPPLLLFCCGDRGLLSSRPKVAIVGTRRCTSAGRTVAHRLGLDLAEIGVGVISGLALGIDAAAHRGALDGGGPAIGVVGTGLDVVYPTRNHGLWSELEQDGLLVSEYSVGTKPQRWRFPARNRLIASLADAVVIVESHVRGGSLLTADEAVDRGKPVLAVPGSVLNPAADGVNGLIVDGALPARDADDVLIALGWSAAAGAGAGEPGAAGGDRVETSPTLFQLDPGDDSPLGGDATSADTGEPGGDVELVAAIRRELATGSVAIDELALLTGCDLVRIMTVLARLSTDGEVRVEGSTVIWQPR